MSTHPHHTSSGMPKQLTLVQQDAWESDIVARLPAGLEEQALTLGAFCRVRKIKEVTDLLRALLAYVVCVHSFRQLGSWAVLLDLANISEAGWRKRLRKASVWLAWLLAELLASPAPTQFAQAHRGCGRVQLIDATRLKMPGGTGDDWRLHMAYDLMSGRLIQVSVTDQHEAESLRYYVLLPGDIVVADAGYGYRKHIAAVREKQAHLVVRLTPSTCPLHEEDGTLIDVVGWLKQKGEGQHARDGWCWHEKKNYRVRLIAQSLAPEAAAVARQSKITRAKKKGHQISEATIFLAGWMLLMTTLPAEQWPAEDILLLYRARWQIELLFKRMKQVLKLNQLRAQKEATIRATILALLVAWALQEEEASQARAVLSQISQQLEQQTSLGRAQSETAPLPLSDTLSEEGPLSSWLLSEICVQTLRVAVGGTWTSADFQEALPLLRRFLRGSPRRRVHQETRLRAWYASLVAS